MDRGLPCPPLSWLLQPLAPAFWPERSESKCSKEALQAFAQKKHDSTVSILYMKKTTAHSGYDLQHNLSDLRMIRSAGHAARLLLCLDTGICSLCKAHLTTRSTVSDLHANQN